MNLAMSNNSSIARVPDRSALARVFGTAGRGLAAFVLVTVTAGFGSCSGGGNAPNYVLTGSVSGLLPGHSVVLQNYDSDTATVSANGWQFLAVRWLRSRVGTQRSLEIRPAGAMIDCFSAVLKANTTRRATRILTGWSRPAPLKNEAK